MWCVVAWWVGSAAREKPRRSEPLSPSAACCIIAKISPARRRRFRTVRPFSTRHPPPTAQRDNVGIPSAERRRATASQIPGEILPRMFPPFHPNQLSGSRRIVSEKHDRRPSLRCSWLTRRRIAVPPIITPRRPVYRVQLPRIRKAADTGCLPGEQGRAGPETGAGADTEGPERAASHEGALRARYHSHPDA